MKKKPAAPAPVAPVAPHPEGLSITPLPDLSQNITLTACGLIFAKETTLEQWKAALNGAVAASTVSGWLIGDALNFGAEHFKKDYKAAVAATGLGKQTLYNMASVAKAFPPDKRRLAVSFEHHRLAAPAMAKGEEKTLAILDRAGTENLSAKAMQTLLPKAKKRDKKLTPEQLETKQIKESAQHREHLEAAMEWMKTAPEKRFGVWGGTLEKVLEFDWQHFAKIAAVEGGSAADRAKQEAAEGAQAS